MTTPVDKAFEAEALTLALKQPLTVNRDFGRTWLTLQFSSDSGTAAFVEIDSLDGKLMHLARTRLVMAGPAAVRVVFALRDLFDLGLEFDCPRGPEAKAKVDQCFKDLDAALAALEGRS